MSQHGIIGAKSTYDGANRSKVRFTATFVHYISNEDMMHIHRWEVTEFIKPESRKIGIWNGPYNVNDQRFRDTRIELRNATEN